MLQGGKKSLKKSESKPKVRKTSLTVKVHTGAEKTEKKIIRAEAEKPAFLTVAPIKEKQSELRKNRNLGSSRKSRSAGFIQGNFSDSHTAQTETVKQSVAKTLPDEAPQSHEARIISAEVLRRREMLMVVGVAFFMVLVVVLWVFQIKQSIKATALENENINTTEWQLAVDDISAKIKEMKDNLEEVKAFVPDTASTTVVQEENVASSSDEILSKMETATTTATTTSAIATSSINELIKKLEKED